jgi:hypothetical protein
MSGSTLRPTLGLVDLGSHHTIPNANESSTDVLEASGYQILDGLLDLLLDEAGCKKLKHLAQCRQFLLVRKDDADSGLDNNNNQ